MTREESLQYLAKFLQMHMVVLEQTIVLTEIHMASLKPEALDDWSPLSTPIRGIWTSLNSAGVHIESCIAHLKPPEDNVKLLFPAIKYPNLNKKNNEE